MFDLFAGLVTQDPLGDAAAARPVFTALAEHVPAARPNRWGTYEPLTESWSDDALDAWDGQDGVIWRPKPAGAAEGWLTPKGPRMPRGTAGLSADRAKVDPAGLLAWVRALAGPLRADYGYLHVASAPDAVAGRRAPGSLTDEGRSGFHLYQSAMTIAQAGIAELMWGTVLGPAYVALIGSAVIASAPAAVVEELAPDVWWLQVTGDPTDPLADWPAFDGARQKVKQHLGARLFFDRDDRRPRLIPDWS